MDREKIRAVLEQVEDNSMTVPEALQKFRSFPYENLNFARLDTHRLLRTGFPEVIFCKGKSTAQITEITRKLCELEQSVIATKANHEIFEEIAKVNDKAVYYETARIVAIGRMSSKKPDKKILVVTGGTSDIPIAEEAAVTSELLGIDDVERLFDVGTAGLHRLTSEIEKLNAADVIIVVAGMEGALASVVGGLTGRPIVAVPTSVGYGSSFEGLAALLAMLNTCAPGVAVMNIDNGFGAGYFAALLN